MAGCVVCLCPSTQSTRNRDSTGATDSDVANAAGWPRRIVPLSIQACSLSKSVSPGGFCMR